MADLHTCAAEHCGAQIPRHRLMCGEDRALVPRATQARVTRAYRHRQRDGWGPYAAAVTEARAAPCEYGCRPRAGRLTEAQTRRLVDASAAESEARRG